MVEEALVREVVVVLLLLRPRLNLTVVDPPLAAAVDAGARAATTDGRPVSGRLLLAVAGEVPTVLAHASAAGVVSDREPSEAGVLVDPTQ